MKIYTDEQLAERIRDCGVSTGETWKHKKTGNFYTIIGIGLIESNCEPMVVYSSDNPLHLFIWLRPLPEFLDGRFEKV